MKRKYWFAPRLNEYKGDDGRVETDHTELANLVGSELENEMHYPQIDLDIPHTYVQSTTPGHGHLTIEQELTWEQYYKLLRALQDAGIVERSYVEFAERRKQTFLRLPHIRKGDEKQTKELETRIAMHDLSLITEDLAT